MLIENDQQLEQAYKHLRIFNAELAGFGAPRDKVTEAMRASLEGQLINIQTDINNYNKSKTEPKKQI